MLEDLAGLAGHVFVGEDEAEAVGWGGGRRVPGRAPGRPRSRGGDREAGREGRHRDRRRAPPSTSRAAPTECVEMHGAGDAFAAGYIAELMREAPLATRLATGRGLRRVRDRAAGRLGGPADPGRAGRGRRRGGGAVSGPAADATARALEDLGIVAVLRGSDPSRVADAARALGAGGVTAVEITYTVPGATEVIARLAARGRPPRGRRHGHRRGGRPTRRSPPARDSWSAPPSARRRSPPARRPTCAPIPGVYTPTELRERRRPVPDPEAVPLGGRRAGPAPSPPGAVPRGAPDALRRREPRRTSPSGSMPAPWPSVVRGRAVPEGRRRRRRLGAPDRAGVEVARRTRRGARRDHVIVRTPTGGGRTWSSPRKGA